MIGRLRGVIQEIYALQFVVDVNGVGYEVTGTRECVAGLSAGQEATITTFTDVRQDEIRLFGFADELEKRVFLLLLKVSGVGTRTAIELLSGLDKLAILRAIGAQDVQALQGVKGVGKKTAERIIVDLKDKVAEHVSLHPTVASTHHMGVEVSTAYYEAQQALEALGFGRREAELAVRRAEENGVSSDQEVGAIVREALRFV